MWASVVVQNRISPSLMRVYGMALLLVMLFAFLYKPQDGSLGLLPAAFFGGNLLFPAMLCGWAIGDALRLHRR